MSKKGKRGKASGGNPAAQEQSRPGHGASAGPGEDVVIRLITLRIKAPFLFPSISAGRFGVDSVGLRDAQNRLIIPQDQIKGVIRDALERIGRADLLADLYGSESGDAMQRESFAFGPSRGRLHFSDLVCKDNLGKTTFAHRVKIDPDSGAAAEGHLMVIEQPVAPGAELDFSGQLHLVGASKEQKDILQAIETALRVPLSIGALKSVGFGRIIDAKLAQAAHSPNVGVQIPPKANRCEWRFTVDRPYLVNARRVAGNAYVGQAAIPGGTLKGALAETLKAKGVDLSDPVLESYLSRLGISFAYPNGTRPVMARSIVYDRARGQFVNLAIADASAVDPVLPLDWKAEYDHAQEAGFLGVSEVTYHERVHTRINAKTGGAEEGLLFSTIAVWPEAFKETAEMSARLDLPLDEVMPMPIQKALETMILPLGRTDAIVKTKGFSKLDRSEVQLMPGRVVVRLLSDALLADPHAEGGRDAQTAYDSFWKTLLPGSTLLDHFAGQVQIGGYQGRRFAPKGKYRPWVLTEAGSVFVFDLAETDVVPLRSLLDTGICRRKLSDVALTWRNCPFVRENGYGQISIYSPKDKDPSTW